MTTEAQVEQTEGSGLYGVSSEDMTTAEYAAVLHSLQAREAWLEGQKTERERLRAQRAADIKEAWQAFAKSAVAIALLVLLLYGAAVYGGSLPLCK